MKILALLLIVFSNVAFAAPDVDRYGELPKVQKMTISPNGQKIAFRLVTPERDLISVISVDPLKAISSFGVSDVKPRNLSFIDNNNLLMSIAAMTSVPGFKGEFEMSVGTTYDISKKKYRQLLVPGKNDVYAGQSSLDQVVGVSPDGKSLYIPAFSGEPFFSQGQQIDPPMSLFKAKINGSGRPRIHKRGRGHALDYFVGETGDVLAKEVFDKAKQKHNIVAYHGKKEVVVFSDDTPYITKDFIGVSIDENYLFMLDFNTDTNRSAVYKLALKDGELTGPLLEKDDADIVGFITDKQRKLLGVRYSGFNPSYNFFDADLDTRVKAILSKFPSHSVWIEEVSPDREHVLVRVEGSQSVGDYFLYSKGKNTVFITSARSNVSDKDIHPITSLTFKARDGMKIPTLVTIPRDSVDNMKNLPAVVMPHGGPSSYDSIGFDYMAQALAEQGYVVIQPQFRGSIGFGAEHQAAGYGEWGRKALFDLSDAVGFFSEQGIIDRQRVCIAGASYGGYSALAGGAFDPDLYKCVVAINGIGNLPAFLSRIRNEGGHKSSSLAFWQAQILGFDKADKNIAKQRSPEMAAQSFIAPVLLIHSEKDQTVHPRQSITMYQALKKAKKDVSKLELKGEDHYLSQGETRLQALRAVVEFINQHLK